MYDITVERGNSEAETFKQGIGYKTEGRGKIKESNSKLHWYKKVM